MRDIQYPGRSAVMSANAMISTSQPMATQVGLEILRSGGNAMDAAIAASATLCVSEPQSTGIGGDCFILFHEAKTGKLHGYNGSGRAPAKATLEEYRARGHKQMPERGILSVSVPGAIEGWQTAMEKFGTMSFAEVLQPAIDFAEHGYVVSPVVANFWNRNAEMLASTEAARNTLLVDGKSPQAGSIHRQPNLAKSLKLIAKEGKQAFYEGAIAQEIVRYSQQQDGLIELEDLAAHKGEWVEPIYTDYRGLRLYEIPPNGQGITALMTLNILENIDLGSLEHLSPDYLHTFVEGYKLACAEQEKYVGDMDFSDVPIEAMLSKSFASEQYGRIDSAHAQGYPMPSSLPEHKDTIYLTVVDKDRNAVSFINSLYMNFGSGMVAGDTGITLQNRGSGFVLEEGHANCVEPRKRPFHTIIPAMAYRGGNPILSFGVMGGFYQPMGHSYVFTNWLDYGMDLQQAIDAPRFLPRQGVLQVERPIPEATRQALRDRGHQVVECEVPHGGGQAIYIDGESGVLQAGSDPRKDGCAMGF